MTEVVGTPDVQLVVVRDGCTVVVASRDRLYLLAVWKRDFCGFPGGVLINAIKRALLGFAPAKNLAVDKSKARISTTGDNMRALQTLNAERTSRRSRRSNAELALGVVAHRKDSPIFGDHDCVGTATGHLGESANRR